MIFYRMWYQGLSCVVRGLKRQLQLVDRRLLWLKEQYVQLYFEEGFCGPMTVDAIRVSIVIKKYNILMKEINLHVHVHVHVIQVNIINLSLFILKMFSFFELIRM